MFYGLQLRMYMSVYTHIRTYYGHVEVAYNVITLKGDWLTITYNIMYSVLPA